MKPEPYYFRDRPQLETPDYRAMVAQSGHRFSSEPKKPGQHKKAKARRRLTKASKRANR